MAKNSPFGPTLRHILALPVRADLLSSKKRTFFDKIGNMKYPLSEFLMSIPDFRRSQGLRYPLDKTLFMIIMSIINGARGYREMARFMDHHQSILCQELNLKHGVPSHVSIRTLLMGIDLVEFNRQFLKWMSHQLSLPKDNWLSIDGKSIRSTVKNAGNKLQTFVQVVNVFTHHSQLVIGQQSYVSSKAEEALCVRQMIKSLDQQGLFICLDALHCQKKH